MLKKVLIFLAVGALLGCPQPAESSGEGPDTPTTYSITNLVAQAGDGQVTLTWTNPTTDSYEVTVSYSGTNSDSGSSTTTSEEITITGLTNGVEYSFSLVAVGGGITSETATTSATAASTDMPYEIYFKTGDSNLTIGDTSIYMKWGFSDNNDTLDSDSDGDPTNDSFTDLDSWQVEVTYGKSADDPSTYSSDAYEGDWSINVTDLEMDTAYTFMIRCLDGSSTPVSDYSTIEHTTNDGTWEYEEISVSNLDDFKDALSTLRPNQTIVLADGDYIADSSFSISNVGGSETNPAIIKAETVGDVSIDLSSTFKISGSSYITIDGFYFTSSSSNDIMKVENSSDIKISNNVFDEEFFEEDRETLNLGNYGGSCENIEIAYNTFKNKDGKGCFIKTLYSSSTGIATNVYIHHNYFLNMMPLILDEATREYDGDSDREAIIFGDNTSRDVDTNNVVEYNLFVDCDGENEIISNKTSSNEYNYNTFINCFGTLSIRYGDDNVVVGNSFIGEGVNTGSWNKVDNGDGTYTVTSDGNYETGGIRLYGSNQLIYNNYFSNLTGETSTHRMAICIDGGSGDHTKVSNSIIAFNTIRDCYYGIGVGMNYTGAPINNSISNNIIAGSSVANIFVVEGDASNTWEGNLSFAGGEADPAGKVALTSDPLLSADSYKLSSDTSPAVGAALGSYSSIDTDIDGDSRSSSNDIGADVYDGGSSTVTLTVADVGPQ